jgi:NAD(P)-dependent dehydrogenase (short-subunit alcohol dehydrogenase family)
MNVLITGAASGIGRRLADIYAGRGATLALLDAAPVERDGAASFVVDVRDEGAVAGAVAQAVTQVGIPDLVVNCAGVQLAKPFEELSGEEFRRVIEINLVGSRNVAAAALTHMRPGSRLVLIASMAGLVPNYSYAAYNASKYGVVGMAEALRLEYAPRGIGISVVCPPEVETPLVDEERRTMHPASRALKEIAGTLELEPACDEIVAGIDRGRFLIIPGRRARAVYRLSKYLPGGATRALSDRTVRRVLGRPTR